MHYSVWSCCVTSAGDADVNVTKINNALNFDDWGMYDETCDDAVGHSVYVQYGIEANVE